MLSPREKDMLREIEEYYGFTSLAAAARTSIRQLHRAVQKDKTGGIGKPADLCDRSMGT